MKPNILLAALLLIGSVVTAQKDTLPRIKGLRPPLPPGPAGGTELRDIIVYEQPNYQGRSGYFRLTNGALTLPFPKTNVSFEVPAGKIVYLRTECNAITSESVYTQSQTSINLENICGIRSDILSSIAINFNGISTEIHNNDCRRIFGEVKIVVYENSADLVQSFMPAGTGANFRGTDRFTFIPFKNENASTTPRISNYVFNNNPVPVLSRAIVNGTVGEDYSSFPVGLTALREGRVKIVVTTSLGSAHKTCDLCDDFSSNVRMKAPVSTQIGINTPAVADGRIFVRGNNQFFVGPFEAFGSRDGAAITASGGTLKKFRVHLSIRMPDAL
jgi:hypothetical protein